MLKFFSTLGILFYLFSTSVKAEDLKIFTTDFCTGYAEGTRNEPKKWAHCCVEHDLNFWVGGTAEEREQADLGLKKCVAATGENEQAQIIYMGVRLGYYSPYHIKEMRWGNGWLDESRAHYQKLTKNEVDLIKLSLTHNPNVDSDLFIRFLDSLYVRSVND